jgi:hypothetical protein
MKRRESDLSVTEGAMKAHCAEEAKRRNDVHTALAKKVSESRDDTNRVLSFLQQTVNSSMERMTNQQHIFKTRIKQQESDQKERFAGYRAELLAVGQQRLKMLDDMITAQRAADEDTQLKQKAEIMRLKENLNRLADAKQKSLDDKQAQLAADAKKAQSSFADRLHMRETELKNARARRQADRQNRRTELHTNFKRDLIHKQELIDSDNSAKLTEFVASCQIPHPFATEIKDHESILGRTTATLNFLNRQIAIAHEDHKKKLTMLSGECSRLEKAKRQIERRRKTETQAIDHEYEMKIQIEQVNLLNAIENIAKLYDADENERGAEIIHGIRQVRETNNHTDTLLLRARHGLRALKQEFAATCADLRGELRRLESGTHESELKQKIEDRRTVAASKLSDLEKRMALKCDNLRKTCATQNSNHEKSLINCQSTMAADNAALEKKSHEIHEEKASLRTHESAEIQKITAEYQVQTVKSIRDHEIDVQRMQQRIASAIHQRDELETKYANEEENQMKQSRAEFDSRCREHSDTNNTVFTALRAKNLELSKTISLLSDRANDAELHLSDPMPRHGEQRKIDNLNSKIQSLDDLSDAAFETLYTTIREAPTIRREVQSVPIPEAETSRPSSSRMARNPNNSISRGSRRESNRLLTPVEPKTRKKSQVLITRQ